MPIFHSTTSYLGLRHTALDAALLDAFSKADLNSYTRHLRPWLLRLECVLQITDAQLTIDDVASPRWRKSFDGFLGALASPLFHSAGYQRICALRSLTKAMLTSVGDVAGATASRYGIGRSASVTLVLTQVREFENLALNEDRIRFWNGWPVTNAKGKRSWLRLFGVHTRYGAGFTDEFHEACRVYFSRSASERVECGNALASFISELPPDVTVENFQDPRWMSDMLADFFYHFMCMTGGNKKPATALAEWLSFANFFERHLAGSIWARPTRTIPRPTRLNVSRHGTNIRSLSSGSKVKANSLTHISLEIPDSETFDCLEKGVRHDLALIQSWAKSEIEGVWSRHERRMALISGERSIGRNDCSRTTQDRMALSEADKKWLLKPASALEQRGIAGLNTYRVVKTRSNELVDALGLPTSYSLLAFAALLISLHPAITPSFIESLELVDRNGNQVGYQVLDGKAYLIGQKPRKGIELAEQRIPLRAEGKLAVERLIEMTKPIRRHFAERNDSRSRLLFLQIPSAGAQPNVFRGIKESNRLVETIRNGFIRHCSISNDEASGLAARFSLKRVRGSAGLCVFLDTKSVQAMAEALGHTTWRPSLIDHYLPKAWQQFFNDRWIRMFQTGLICKALENSIHLRTACGLDSPEQLATFIKNHALKIAFVEPQESLEDARSSREQEQPPCSAEELRRAFLEAHVERGDNESLEHEGIDERAFPVSYRGIEWTPSSST